MFSFDQIKVEFIGKSESPEQIRYARKLQPELPLKSNRLYYFPDLLTF